MSDSHMAAMTNYQSIRERLRNPSNAVEDDGIDLKRRKTIPILTIPIVPDEISAAEQDNADIDRLDMQIAELCAQFDRMRGHVSVYTIQRKVAAHYKISMAELLSNARPDYLVRPRHVAIYLARRMTGLSYNRIGQKFARDHTSIIHAIKSITANRQTDAALDNLLNALAASIRPAVEAA